VLNGVGLTTTALSCLLNPVGGRQFAVRISRRLSGRETEKNEHLGIDQKRQLVSYIVSFKNVEYIRSEPMARTIKNATDMSNIIYVGP
jgi:hypothetical protein